MKYDKQGRLEDVLIRTGIVIVKLTLLMALAGEQQATELWEITICDFQHFYSTYSINGEIPLNTQIAYI